MYGSRILKDISCRAFSSNCCNASSFNLTTRQSFSTTKNFETQIFVVRIAHKRPVLIPPKILANLSRRGLSEVSSNNNDSGKLLYIGTDGSKLKKLLGMFYGLSAGVTAASPYLFGLAHGSTFATIFIGIEVFTFVILNPFLLYKFGKRYVNELYYNKSNDTYTVHVLSPLVYKDNKLSFSPKECKMPANPTVFTSFLVNNRPLFINSDAMDYDAYMKMLRYATDFDFENPERQEQYSETIKSAIEQKQNEQVNEANKRDKQ